MYITRVLAVLSVVAFGNGCATPPNPASAQITQSGPVTLGPEYVVSGYVSKSGNQVYLLKCKNKTTLCYYEWETLCKQGTAKNVDPEGNVIEAPGYVRDKDNTPLLMFACK